jgi:MFS-type transporter involved in bile tolerance (Atg22 family)
VHRALYGTLLVEALLLYRNYFFQGSGNKALGHVTELVITSAIGFGLAAFITPPGVKRLTKDQWIIAWLLIGGVTTLALGPTFNQFAYLLLGFALGLSAQCVKICVDTTIQQTVDDAYMGRVFSLYDMLFNVAYVVGPAVAVPFMPTDGKSFAVVIVIGVLYLAAAAAYAALTQRTAAAQSPPAQPTPAARR